jgi:hypothetical protein
MFDGDRGFGFWFGPPGSAGIEAWTAILAEIERETDAADADAVGSGAADADVANFAVKDSAARDAGRIDAIRALEELKAAAAAAQARLAAAFDVSQRAAQAGAGVPVQKQGKGVAAQVALARRESPARAGRLLGFAKALVHEMPYTLAALEAGKLSEWRATLLVRETACLAVEDRRRVDQAVAGNPEALDGMGERKLVAEAKRAAYRIDPHSVANRAARAAEERFVGFRPAPDTMVWVSALLPVREGTGVRAALEQAADAARRQGDARTRGQVMADTFYQRLTGREPAEPVDVEIQLVMTDRTLFQGESEPAHLPGYGIIPAQDARNIARGARNIARGARNIARGDSAGRASQTGGGRQARQPADSAEAADAADAAGRLWLRRLYTAPATGALIGMDSRARLVPQNLRRMIQARDRTCRTPWCDAPIRHHDHVVAWNAGGPTTETNIQGLCENCNQAKEAPGWQATPVTPEDASASGARAQPGARHTVRITTPTGHAYHSTAPPLPGADPPRPQPAPAPVPVSASVPVPGHWFARHGPIDIMYAPPDQENRRAA